MKLDDGIVIVVGLYKIEIARRWGIGVIPDSMRSISR
jgi:hypothetical protein